MRSIRAPFFRLGTIGLCAALGSSACADEPEKKYGYSITAGTGYQNVGGASGTSLPTARAGTGAVSASGSTASPPVAGSSVTGVAGLGGVAGQGPVASAGTSAAAGNTALGGTGGAAGSGGAAGGATIPVAGDALIRGPEPTQDSASNNGPYNSMTYTSGFADGQQFLAGTIYYPEGAEPPFAGVVICPGFTALQASVAPWGPFLSSHGIVVMTIDTNTTGDSVDVRVGALMDALTSLKGEQTRTGSPLEGKLDMTRFGLMGWSMGGGGAWINANTHPELKTAISLAGHIATQIGGSAQFTKVTVPTLLLAGSADTGILGLAMSQPVYDTIPDSTPKLLYEVNGASHFDISPATGGKLFGLYGLSWQKVFLEGDMRYKQFLLLPKPANASDFRSNVK